MKVCKVVVHLRSNDMKQTTMKKIWSDQVTDYMQDWQEMLWHIMLIEKKDW